MLKVNVSQLFTKQACYTGLLHRGVHIIFKTRCPSSSSYWSWYRHVSLIFLNRSSFFVSAHTTEACFSAICSSVLCFHLAFGPAGSLPLPPLETSFLFSLLFSPYFLFVSTQEAALRLSTFTSHRPPEFLKDLLMRHHNLYYYKCRKYISN